MNIIKKARSSKQRDIYVYYNDWTGEILSLGKSKRSDTPAPYITANDEIARNIFNGTASETHYMVTMDFGDGQKLVKKDEVLRLRRREDDLFLLPRQRLNNWDIRTKIYTDNSRFVVEFNPGIIDRLVSIKMRKEITLDRDAEFEFYIVRKDRPDHLIKTIKVDAESLIVQGKQAFDISDVVKYASLHDVDVLTRRYFENYYVTVTRDQFIDTADQRKFKRYSNRWQFVSSAAAGHFTFEQENDILTVKSNVTVNELNELEFFMRKMKFYVVGKTPDHLIDTFAVNVANLRMGRPERFLVDFDIDDIGIMFQNPQIKINKRKVHDTDTN